MNKLEIDSDGFPILLADKAATAEPAPSPSSWQTGQWDRRTDAVRDFAREFETFAIQDLRELVRGRTNRELTDTEMMQFLADVRDQQLVDLMDILDQLERGTLRKRRLVRIQAPRGYIRKTMNALNGGELTRMEERLRARGWNDDQIAKGLHGRLPQSKTSLKP